MYSMQSHMVCLPTYMRMVLATVCSRNISIYHLYVYYACVMHNVLLIIYALMVPAKIHGLCSH